MQIKNNNPKKDTPITFTGKVILDISDDIKPLEIDGVDIIPKIWELAGAPDNSAIKVKRQLLLGKIPVIHITVKNPGFFRKPMIRQIISQSTNSESTPILIIENVNFYLKKEFQNQGVARKSLQLEAKAAQCIQIGEIIANVAGSASKPEYTGYKVWPRLGYDAEIADDIMKKIPEEHIVELKKNGPIKISDLLENNLYKFWEDFGEGCMMTFDTSSDDTKSMQRLFKNQHY